MKITLVTTTIHIPVLLKEYARDAKAHEYNNLNIIVIGDNKTPAETEVLCTHIAKSEGLKVRYYGAQAQIEYLENYPALNQFLPWDCIQRRNLGILMAYEEGSEWIVTIDDDNYLAQENYIGNHNKVGKMNTFPAISSETGWFNVCNYLQEAQNRKFYPRGYPVLQRSKEGVEIKEKLKSGRIVVNAGFWLGDPDVDAVTRLAAPLDVIGYNRSDHFALDIGTWSPFNSQNTALWRGCIPAYFLCSGIGRFDDIWASYIVKRIADHLGDYVTFGPPLVKQQRNPHDLWNDLELEKMGMQLTDVFCNWLRETPLKGLTYHDCTIELINELKIRLNSETISYQHRAYINHFIDGYRVWSQTIASCTQKQKNRGVLAYE